MAFVPARAGGGGALSRPPLFMRWRGPLAASGEPRPLRPRLPPPRPRGGPFFPSSGNWEGKLGSSRAQGKVWRHYYDFSGSCWILPTTLSCTGPQIHGRQRRDLWADRSAWDQRVNK